jgi:hypothetical protein
MFGRKFKSDVLSRLARLEKTVSLHAESHSGQMNQSAGQVEGLRQAIQDGFDELHKRISFMNRPKA